MSTTAPTRSLLLVCAALSVLGLALYLPSLRYGFVEYDDVRIVLDHPNLFNEHSLLASLREIFVGYFPREEPLLVRDVTWAINSRLFGFHNGVGYHLGNLLLNAVNAPLLFLFLKRATGRMRFAAVVAALFAVLPSHVEPVCWVMGRKDVLSAFFALATLLAEAHAFHTADGRRARRLRIFGLVTCALAIFSKISAVTLFLVVAAYRLLAPPLASGGKPTSPRSVRERAFLLLGVTPHLVVSALAFVWYNRILHRWGVLGGSHAAFSAVLWVRMISLTLGLYVKSLFALSDYSIAYSWPDSAIPLTITDELAAVAAGFGILAFVVWAARRRRDLLFYALAFFALMLPYLHFVDVIRWRADRYLYLSSFCILAILVQAVADLLPRASGGLQRVITGAAIAWALVACFVTLTNAPRFRDNHALWTYEVALERPSVLAYESLAASFVDRARREHDAVEKQRLLGEAERVAHAGIAYHQSIPWRKDAEPKLDYANLYVQLGLAAGLRSEPLPAQLEHYLASYRILPTETNILFLAQSYYALAVSRGDLELARKSLRLFAELVASRAADTSRRALALRVHDLYRKSFPALAPEIDAIERQYLR